MIEPAVNPPWPDLAAEQIARYRLKAGAFIRDSDGEDRYYPAEAVVQVPDDVPMPPHVFPMNEAARLVMWEEAPLWRLAELGVDFSATRIELIKDLTVLGLLFIGLWIAFAIWGWFTTVPPLLGFLA